MRTVVGVLRGGPSSEYEVSLKSGASVLEALPKEKYDARDIFIDRTGAWHNRGIAGDPARALAGVDVVFNTIHGAYGEDGRLHEVLDPLGVVYTGAGRLPSVLAFNKARTKEEVTKLGVKVAHGTVVEPNGEYESLAHELFRTFPHPAIVKPVIGGSSVGTSIVCGFHDLAPALERAAVVSPKVLIEEFITGREATVGIIDHFRGERAYALMPVEILTPREKFFDLEHTHNDHVLERVPGNFTNFEKKELERLAKLVHESLGLSDYSRSDFIVSPRGIYFLEVNSAAGVGLTNQSLLPKALTAVGSSLPQFVEHVVELARRRV